MAFSRLPMRKILEVLRLHHGGKRSHREIARAVVASPTTVGEVLRRAKLAGLGYPLPSGMTEIAVEAALYPSPAPSSNKRPEPDWVGVHRDLRRKSVTLDLLWQEYKAEYPDGYQYSSFCDHYRAWSGRLSVSMRQTHAPGEKLFVDYAGPTVAVTDPHTGEIRRAALFVAVLGASNYTYCEATWSQGLPDWIGSHVRAFEFFGGVPAVLVPDNLKSGVNKVCAYDPQLNPTYHDLAEHYGTAVIPARPRHPKDKAKVEAGVLLVERWILARLRHQRFFSLDELNRQIASLLADLNQRPFKKLPGCRASAFAELDRPALRALPGSRYEFAEWKIATVGIDYHIEVAGHYYSVPFRLARQKVDVRMTAMTIDVFQRGQRMASHLRNTARGRHTTVDAHMTPAHQAVNGWNAPRLLDWAGRIGGHTKAVIEHILHQRRHPQQGYRTALGVLRLAKTYGPERLEAACNRAFRIHAVTWRSIDSILKHNLDRKPRVAAQATLPLDHANLRGPEYYH